MLIDDFHERNSMLAAIIDSSEDAIISKNLDGIILSWNKSAERVFGYLEQEALGKHISLLIPEDRLPEEEMIISNLKQGNRIEHFETIRKRKNGELLHISLTVSPIKNGSGKIIGASKIARDITKQKETEEVIRRYTKQLELINSTGRAISAHLDIQTILQTVTDTCTQLSGAAFGAFFYNKISSDGESYTLYTISGVPRSAFEKFPMPRNTGVFKTTFEGEGVLRSDDITKDPRYGKNPPFNGMPEGHLPVVSYLAVPVTSATGVVIGGLFFGHPRAGVFNEEHEMLVVAIASQAAIALDNAKLYEEVRHLNGKKDEFIGFASHELKTPLTTMNGYLQLAEKRPELMSETIPKIRKQINRLSAIISDLLDISKINAGKLELNYSETNLNVLIRECLETVSQEVKHHKVQVELPHDDVIIRVDAQKLSQVIINLLTNAAKYSQPGTIIRLDCSRFGDSVRISVEDQGMGIAPQHIDRIFNRFYRIAKSSSYTEGMGLGLYISQEIITGHKGRIWVESEEGKGSTFHINLPITSRESFDEN